MQNRDPLVSLVEVGLINKPEQNCNDDKQNDNTFEDFDDILDAIGGDGRFQKFILYVIIGSFMVLIDLPALHKIFALSTPNHNCHVEGRPFDMDLVTWKKMTVPKETGPDGTERFSQCLMLTENASSVRCSRWDYDKTDFDATIPTDFDWVCEKSHYVTNVYTAIFIGHVFGAIVFGRAADRWGRKPMIYLTLSIYIVAQTIALFTPQHFLLFLAINLLSEIGFPFLFTATLMLASEMSGKDYRAWIFAVSQIIWVVGQGILSVIAWYVRSWFLSSVLMILPVPLLLLTYFYFPESPRWLIGVGRLDEAEKIILNIAQVNDRSIDVDKLRASLRLLWARDKEDEEKNNTVPLLAGMLVIFKKPKLARNTLLLGLASVTNLLVFDGLTLSATTMSGNQFLNYFLLALIEIPATVLAGILVDKTGRRWTLAGFNMLCCLACVVASISVFHPSLSFLVVVAAVTAKFAVGVCGLVENIMGVEIFPTQLRSTGTGIYGFGSTIIGISAPYVVYLGRINAAAPYILLAILSLVSSIGVSHLPETYNVNLPESVDEANDLGKGQSYWTFLPNGRADDKVRQRVSVRT